MHKALQMLLQAFKQANKQILQRAAAMPPPLLYKSFVVQERKDFIDKTRG